MKALARYTLMRLLALLPALLTGFVPGSALGQQQAFFSQQQLDRMLAPVALYPDPLLSQLLMASTHTLDVVEAARWAKAHPGLQGDAAVMAVAQQDWDPSVKSLAAFPQLLAWMDENLEWTRGLGNAFLAQGPQVMETVQALRRKAQAAGTLRSDDRIRVLDDAQSIAVVPADPQILYVPYYDPLLVYGTWWWPAHPPVRWRPWPGYSIGPGYAAALPSLYWGPGIVISTGILFGAFDWPRHQVRVVGAPYHYYSSVTVNRPPARAHSNAVPVNTVNPVPPVNRGPGVWQPNPAPRAGVGHRDRAVPGYGAPRVDAPRPTAAVPAPRAREPRPEIAGPQGLRVAASPPAAPRVIAPHPEFRAGHPQTGGVAAVRAEPRNQVSREPGRTAERDARPASPQRGHGDRKGPG